MDFTPRMIRLLALIGIVAVSGGTLASYLVLRSREESVRRPLPPKIAPDVHQQTQAFSLSKTLGGSTLYTVRAGQVTNFKETGKTVLHDVSILLYDKQGLPRDRITSQECEFDPATATFFISGEVEIELGALAASAGGPQPGAPVQVVTTALRFDQNTGTASTESGVRFRSEKGQGTSQGAVYDPQQQSLILKKDVRLWLRPEDSADGLDDLPEEGIGPPDEWNRAGWTHLRAGSLRFQSGDRRIYMGAPVAVIAGARKLQAGDSQILLDDQQRAEKALLSGGIYATETGSGGSSEIRSARAELEFSSQGIVRKLLLEEQVQWTLRSGASLKEGQAGRAEFFFREAGGQLDRVHASDGVRINLSRISSSAGEFPGSARQASVDGDSGQALTAGDVVMRMAEDGETLSELRTESASRLRIFPSIPGEMRRMVDAERFTMTFDPGGDLTRFAAEGSVRVVADSLEGSRPQKTSSSDHLTAVLDPLTHSLSRMEQWGNFRYQEAAMEARATRAVYLPPGETVILTGEPAAWNSSGKISAREIRFNGAANELQAAGDVATTIFSPSGDGTVQEPVHVVAEQLRYDAASEKAVYEGKVRLWQGGNLLEAGRMELDRGGGRLLARTGVYSLFQQDAEPAGKKDSLFTGPQAGSGSGQQPFEIRAEQLVYDQRPERKAVYSGGVRARNADTRMASEVLEIFFVSGTDEPSAGNNQEIWQVSRAIGKGSVRIEQGSRKATGEQADYSPLEGEIRLLGKMATVADPQRGVTQGTRLTYFIGDDRILVDGEPDSRTETRKQVSP